MKHELKIEIKDTNLLLEFINNSYNDGVLIDKTQVLKFDNTTPTYLLCKGLHNLAVRICNEDIIEGCVRCIIQEEEDMINIYPCSIKYEIDNNKYSFII